MIETKHLVGFIEGLPLKHSYEHAEYWQEIVARLKHYEEIRKENKMNNVSKKSKVTPLSDYETEQLSNVMQMCENDEYHDGGWKNLNGGYAECELVDSDNETVQFDLMFGQQDMGGGGSEEYTDNITISREVLANKKLSIREKVTETY